MGVKFAAVSVVAVVVSVLSLLGAVDPVAAQAAGRPTVLMSASDVARIKASIGTSEIARTYDASLLARAEEQLKTSPETYRLPDGIRLLNVSRSVLDRSLTLGMAYQLTGDTRFSDRLWKELDAATKFKDWNPAHFLDTAEMATAVSLGSDWIADRLSSAQRSQISRAIQDLAFTPAKSVFLAPANSPGPYKYGGNWSQLTNNWNVVINSSLIIASIAVGVQNSAEAKDIQSRSLESLRRGLSSYGPDGGYAEGFAYWDYASRYALMAITALRSVYGTDYGLAASSGLARGGDFAIYGADNGGRTFNFGDSDVRATNSAAMLGFGRVFNRSDVMTAGVLAGDTTQPALRLLWLDAALVKVGAAPTAPLDSNFAAARVATLRSSWTDPLGNFIGLRTGRVPGAPHQNLDAGTFYLTSQGEEWATELQKDEYNLKGYFDDGAAGEGWNYYRKRAEGQNTLVVNPFEPDIGQGWSDSTGAAVKVQSSPSGGFAIAQLDAVYSDQNVKWSRGVALVNGRSEFVVQDEASATKPFEALWSMHTRAQVRVAEDGRSALLYLNGKRMRASIDAGAGAKFVVSEASPLPSSPNPPQSANDGVRKLSVFMPAATEVRLTVRFTPSDESAVEMTGVKPLTSWSAPTNEGNHLNYLSVDGKWVGGFNPNVRYYTVFRDPSRSLPIVSAGAPSGLTVGVVAPKKIPGTARVTVSDSAGRVDMYVVRFMPEPITFSGSVTASYTKEGVPDYTVDPDRSSFWATWGDRSIVWDLASLRTLRALEVSWKSNKNKKTKFEVETSSDGKNWVRTHDEWANGDNPVTVSAFGGDTRLRYVRLQVHGDTTSDLWSAILDVRFLAWNPADEAAPTASASPAASLGGIPAQMTVGDTAQGSVRVGDSTSMVRFVSGAPALLSISQDGKVTALGGGAANVGAVIFVQNEAKFVSQQVNIADPDRIRLYSSGDSYVQGGTSAGLNFGNEKSLFSKPTPRGWNDSLTTRYAYVAFNMGSLKGKDVASAKLNLSGSNVDSQGESVKVNAHAVPGSWTEMGVTFVNRPVLGDQIGVATFNRNNAYQEFDVTAAVRSRAAAGAGWIHVGLSQDIEGSSPRLVRFDSEESLFKPYIEVVLNPSR